MKSLATLVAASTLTLAAPSFAQTIGAGFIERINDIRVTTHVTQNGKRLLNISTYQEGAGRVRIVGELTRLNIRAFEVAGDNSTLTSCNISFSSPEYARLERAIAALDDTTSLHLKVDNRVCSLTASYDADRDGVTPWNAEPFSLSFDPTDPGVFLEETMFSGSSTLNIINPGLNSSFTCNNEGELLAPQLSGLADNLLTQESTGQCSLEIFPEGVVVDQTMPLCQMDGGVYTNRNPNGCIVLPTMTGQETAL